MLAGFSDAELAALEFDWQFWGRPDQLAPTDRPWTTWLILAGRGWGKTRTGAEWVRQQIESGACSRMALVAPTAADVRDVMVEGESGLLAIAPPDNRPIYEPSKRRLTWPSGAMATLYSADEPERLRGPQSDGAWCDEVCSWRYPEALDMLRFGLRLGARPRMVVTTTPKPLPHLRSLLAEPTTRITRGRTWDNAPNLAPSFLAELRRKYEGTRLGRQEIDAEILDDVEGALWKSALIEATRVKAHPDLMRVVVAIDPAVSNDEGSDETGIVVAGIARCGCKGGAAPELHGFVLEDLSGKFTPDEWVRRSLGAYRERKADRIVAEVNNGGALIESAIRTQDRHAAYKAVHASQGKRTRAEPIAALYEQGKVHHVGGFPKLEDQMVTWDPLGDVRSPDRLDALVWALTELMLPGAVEYRVGGAIGSRRI